MIRQVGGYSNGWIRTVFTAEILVAFGIGYLVMAGNDALRTSITERATAIPAMPSGFRSDFSS